jgi:hypothetical protein
MPQRGAGGAKDARDACRGEGELIEVKRGRKQRNQTDAPGQRKEQSREIDHRQIDDVDDRRGDSSPDARADEQAVELHQLSAMARPGFRAVLQI